MKIYFVNLQNDKREEKKLIVVCQSWSSQEGGLWVALEKAGPGWEVENCHEILNSYAWEVKSSPTA